MGTHGVETCINQNQFKQKGPVKVKEVVSFTPGKYHSCRMEDHLKLHGRSEPAYSIFIRPR